MAAMPDLRGGVVAELSDDCNERQLEGHGLVDLAAGTDQKKTPDEDASVCKSPARAVSTFQRRRKHSVVLPGVVVVRRDGSRRTEPPFGSMG